MEDKEFKEGLEDLTVEAARLQFFDSFYQDDDFTKEQRVIVFKRIIVVLQELITQEEKELK